VENLQRANLSPLEEARGYEQLIQEFSHTQEKLGELLGKSRSHVANMIRLLSLPDSVKSLITSGALSAGHARALLNASNPGELAKLVVKRGLNVRQTETLAKKAGVKSRKSPNKYEKDANTLALEREISTSLGLSVSIHFTPSGGKVTVNYDTLEQLDEVLGRLKKH
jgi:ParB family chromosome partitioning protein